jgi:putative oxidoreductase
VASLTALHDIAVHDGAFVARIFLSAVFLYSGQDKLRHWKDSVAEVAGLQLPWPGFFAAATIATQLLGGLSVLFGIGTAWGAAVLAAFTVAATVLGHRFWLLKGARARQAFMTSLEHLAIVGGLLLLMVDSL